MGALLLPNEDLAIVAGGCEDVAVLGVGPRDAPDGALVALERLRQSLRLALDLENLDGLVGGAGGEAAAVVVENGIMLFCGISQLGDWSSCHVVRAHTIISS